VDPWADRLSDYLDDELPMDERRALEQHLVSCAECRASLVELRAVIQRARTLPSGLPATDLWPGVEQRVRQGRPARRLFTVSLPQLAAAALLLMALSGGLVWMLRQPAPSETSLANAADAPRTGRAPGTALPVSFADETYDQAVADLQGALERGRGQLDPATVKVIEKNLAVIDAAIEQAQRALESDPSNTYLNGHLVHARQHKLALLRRINAMADPQG
jgi:anti-sigma factor RsiW